MKYLSKFTKENDFPRKTHTNDGIYISDQFIKTSTPTWYVENWCYNRKYHLPYNLFAPRNVIA